MRIRLIGALCFILAASAHTLFAQPFGFDKNGNGTMTDLFLSPPEVTPLPFEVAQDPTGGVTTSPVLMYSLGWSVFPGDVAFMAPYGNTILDLLRFFTPAGSSSSDVIFYSQSGGGSLADVGIPATTDPVEIRETSPVTAWYPNSSLRQPGGVTASPAYARFEYDVTVIDTPEPSSETLLLVSMGVWLGARVPCQKGISA